MSYVASLEMIKKAQKDGYAVPAFNAENLEMVQAIIAAAEQEQSPVMIQTTSPTTAYLTLDAMVAIVKTIAGKAKVPVALHLDHCTKFDDVMKALRAGYTSVMFDGSKLPFDENVRLTKQVVEAARPMGVTVEAELGTVGGKEDSVSADIYIPTKTRRKPLPNRRALTFLQLQSAPPTVFTKANPNSILKG